MDSNLNNFNLLPLLTNTYEINYNHNNCNIDWDVKKLRYLGILLCKCNDVRLTTVLVKIF